jgi:putative ABC transport system substrate-binding protein
MGNVSSSLIAAEMREAQSTALRLGLEVGLLEITQGDDIPLAFNTALNDRADALYVCADPLTGINRVRIVSLAQAARLSTMFSEREFVEAGGLISYGPNSPDLFRRAAELVDKILRGANPADIPVEQPTKFDLMINLKTARVLGIDVPPTLLARADEVIE